MEAEEEECARLIAEEDTRIDERIRLKSETEDQARLKAEDAARIAD